MPGSFAKVSPMLARFLLAKSSPLKTAIGCTNSSAVRPKGLALMVISSNGLASGVLAKLMPLANAVRAKRLKGVER
jgi:hypothetical protein